jgi:ABC-type multidrug transport system fused ATPase/permease subunit
MSTPCSRLSASIGSLREIGTLLWSQATPFVKGRLVAALVLISAASVCTALGPLALKRIVDSFSAGGRVPPAGVALLIGLYVGSRWLARAIGEIRGWVYARAERRMSRTLSEKVFAHVLALPFRFHLERQTGAITQSLTQGLQGYQSVMHTLLFSLLPVATELGTILLVLSRLGKPRFLILFAAAVMGYAIAFGYAARRTMRAARRASSAQIAATARMTDSLMNTEAIKYFAAETLVKEGVVGALTRTEEEWVRFYRQFAVNGLIVATIYAAFLSVAIVWAAQDVLAGVMTLGTFVLVNTYMLQLVQPVETLGYAVQSLSQGMAYLENVRALLRENVEDAATSGAPPDPGHPVGEIEFCHVSVAYRADRAVLRDVSFVVPEGQTLGIVGASGSGKSTLVRLLTRLLEPDAGEINLNGTPVSAINLSSLRGSIAVVPQDTILFDETLAYNIGFGKAGSRQDEIEEAARLAHLHDFIVKLPDGYQTRVGERGVKLSGGEKQRVSIARAALRRPQIYVFDEATSSLDSQTERDIVRNLEEISRTRTTLIIAHRLSSVVHADEIIVLDAGVIVERGTHASLLAQRSRYAALWEAQHRGTVVARHPQKAAANEGSR